MRPSLRRTSQALFTVRTVLALPSNQLLFTNSVRDVNNSWKKMQIEVDVTKKLKGTAHYTLT
jgi:hypothetical protein